MTFTIYTLLYIASFLAGLIWGWFMASETKIKIEKKPSALFFDETVATQHGRLPSAFVVKWYDFEDGEVITRTCKCYRN